MTEDNPGTRQFNAARNVARIRCTVAAGDGAHADATPCEIYSRAFCIRAGVSSSNGTLPRWGEAAVNALGGTGPGERAAFQLNQRWLALKHVTLSPSRIAEFTQADLILNNTWRHNLPRSP